MRRVRGGGSWQRRWVVAAVAAAVLLAPTLVATLVSPPGAVALMWAPSSGLATNYDFAQLVLRDGGWPDSPSNVTVLTQWLRAEEPPSHWWNRDNPLNNGLGSGGGSGLGSYGSVVTAAFDVARNLEQPGYGYPLIVRDLHRSAPAAATAWAIWRSSWAAGHYGWGANWGTTPVPSIPAPPIAWQSPTRCPVAYPASVRGPCGGGFTTTGAAWQPGSDGIAGQELWEFAGPGATAGVATWAPRLAPGTYAIAAFVPAAFSDAIVTYHVTDATGVHAVRVNQEPYADAWAPLGEFEAGASLSVSLGTASAGPRGSFVAADAVRFLRVPGHAQLSGPVTAQHPAIHLPGPPQDVTAVATTGAARVTWLAPSKDGGAPVRQFTVTAEPGGRTCVAGAGPSASSCVVTHLTNGDPYRFTVRARSAAGVGAASSPSAQAVPLGVPALRVLALAKALEVGARIVYRATVAPAPGQGTVLFAVDGLVLPGCQRARIVKGHAACATRLRLAGSTGLLVTFSGSRTLTGDEATLGVVVRRASTTLRAVAQPTSVLEGTTTLLHASHLPGEATGQIVFTAGAVRLCVATVRSGGGRCTARLSLSPGVHLVEARYLGDRSYRSSIARTTVRVVAPAAP